MDMTSSIRVTEAIAAARARRESFNPTNRELAAVVHPIYGRSLDSLQSSELATARLVFAQAALMAGAALAADSETFFGAEQLWRDMQGRIGVQERALARRLLELLSADEYYSESERRLIRVLARTMCESAERQRTRSERAAPEQPRPPFARLPIQLNNSTIARLRAQRDSFAPSERMLTLLFQAEFGTGRSAFRADELRLARMVFSQVVLMVGAALAADPETYLCAEQLWADMQAEIGVREREFARRTLDLLSGDRQYTGSERKLIEALAGALAG